jgi:ATP-dependent Clp protease adapter protein ClpS
MTTYYGIKVYNNDVTPMDDVLALLETCLDMSAAAAFEAMMAVHQKDGYVVVMARQSEIEGLAARLKAGISERECELTFEVVGPFSEFDHSEWQIEIRSAGSPPSFMVPGGLLLIGFTVAMSALILYLADVSFRWGGN